MSTFSRHRRKRLREFKNRLKTNNGPDRTIGAWQIIDIHEIPEIIGENIQYTRSFGRLQEFDFYCCNQKDLYLLRLTKAGQSKYSVFKPESTTAVIYLIAELNFTTINDEFIEEVLKIFTKAGIPKTTRAKISFNLKNTKLNVI